MNIFFYFYYIKSSKKIQEKEKRRSKKKAAESSNNLSKDAKVIQAEMSLKPNVSVSKEEKNTSVKNMNEFSEKPKNEINLQPKNYDSGQNVTIENLKDLAYLPKDIEKSNGRETVIVHMP